MIRDGVHSTVHSATVPGDAASIYRWLEDVTRWPDLFGPTVHAVRIEGDDSAELIRLWALANGEVRTWESRRDLDPGRRRIVFRQAAPKSPLASMSGSWTVREQEQGHCEVVLTHEYSFSDPTSPLIDFVDRAVEGNSVAELGALARVFAEENRYDESTGISFTDTVELDAPARSVYDFIDRADLWPARLPHVTDATLKTHGDIQELSMVTRSRDGGSHPTASVRIAFPRTMRMAYKQTTLPPVLRSHSGSWAIESLGEGRCRASATHTVFLDMERARADYPDSTIAELKALVRGNLGTNSRQTLASAQEHYAARASV
jgi:aromatase